MSRILAIESTLGSCSVALSSGEFCEVSERNKQTSELPGMVQHIMQKAAIGYHQLDGYAVTSGPGSFTGVRLGLAFVRGLALVNPKPIYAISTLQLLAYQAIQLNLPTPYISAINAYRGEYYIQHFMLENQMPKAASEPIAVKQIDFTPGSNITVIGDIKQAYPMVPSALSLAHYSQLIDQPAAEASPLYIRAPDAKPQKGDLTTG